MAYQLKSLSIRTNNTEGGMAQIDGLWQDVTSGKLPLLFDSEGQFLPGISPISRYSHYASDETGDYDLSVLAVHADFFAEMEQKVAAGQYKKYEEAGEDMGLCAKTAWERVWRDQSAGTIKRAFSEDYESAVPTAYAKDGLAHCYLYIAVQ